MTAIPYLMDAYRRLEVSFTHGESVWVWDEQQRRHLDGIAGIGVLALGHAHPAVTATIQRQASRLLHVSNMYRIKEQEQLAHRLCTLCGMEAAFFSNSGAEANEAAIKLARLHGQHLGLSAPHVVVMQGAFHGRTLATLAATGNQKLQQGFAPLPDGFLRVPYDDRAALEELASSRTDIAAVLVEPIQGEGGVRCPTGGYLSFLRQLCNRQGWLLMIDEVQTGLGRTGHWLAHQHEADVQPDVITLAKALGNGLPIGATLARGPASHLFTPGSHGSTFGGNPLACATATTVLESLQDVIPQVTDRGALLQECLRQHLTSMDCHFTLRGQGLMLGITLHDADAAQLADLPRIALEHEVLLNVTAGTVVRLLPPLILQEQDAVLLAERVTSAIDHCLRRP
jgi:acetylornithine aminotransferase